MRNPTHNFGLENSDEIFRLGHFVGLYAVPEVIQEGFNAFLGRLYKKFVLIAPDTESQEVKALINMRD